MMTSSYIDDEWDLIEHGIKNVHSIYANTNSQVDVYEYILLSDALIVKCCSIVG